MAKSTQPATQFQLARVPGTPEALSSRTTTDCRTANDEKGGFADLSRIAEASILEEPGARKPHAGICAGRGRETALSTATVAFDRKLNRINRCVRSFI